MMKYIIGFFFILLCCNLAMAEEQSSADLAKAAQNPIANMISLPFQNNTNFNISPDDATQNILNIQPVIPFSLNENWNVITRTIFPVTWQPVTESVPSGGYSTDTTFGLGDTTFTAFLSPKKSEKITWGIGPVVLLPTATDEVLGTREWGAGPSLVVLAMPGHWVIGSLFSNIWSFAGWGDHDVNLFTWQYFINYNLSHGWYLVTAPIITANWEADSDTKWTVPFGGGIGKIFKVGKQPLNGQVSAYYNVEKPDNGPDWQLRIQLQFLFPK